VVCSHLCNTRFALKKLKDVDIRNFTNDEKKAPGFLSHALLRTSKQIRTEAMSIFVEIHRIAINSGTTLDWFTKWLDETKAQAKVRQLFFPSFDFFSKEKYGPVNGDMTLIKSCTGLKSTTLKFHVKHLVSRPTYDGELSPINLQEVIEAYCMNELFKCDSLRGVTLLVQGHTYYDDNTVGDPFQSAKELAKYLEDGFKECGLRVDVRMVVTYG